MNVTGKGGAAAGDAAHVYEPYGVSTYGFMPSFQFTVQF